MARQSKPSLDSAVPSRTLAWRCDCRRAFTEKICKVNVFTSEMTASWEQLVKLSWRNVLHLPWTFLFLPLWGRLSHEQKEFLLFLTGHCPLPYPVARSHQMRGSGWILKCVGSRISNPIIQLLPTCILNKFLIPAIANKKTNKPITTTKNFPLWCHVGPKSWNISVFNLG